MKLIKYHLRKIVEYPVSQYHLLVHSPEFSTHRHFFPEIQRRVTICRLISPEHDFHHDLLTLNTYKWAKPSFPDTPDQEKKVKTNCSNQKNSLPYSIYYNLRLFHHHLFFRRYHLFYNLTNLARRFRSWRCRK